MESSFAELTVWTVELLLPLAVLVPAFLFACYFVRHWTNVRVSNLFLCAILIRLLAVFALGLFLWHFTGSAFAAADDQSYHLLAESAVEGLQESPFPEGYSQSNPGFNYFNYYVYLAFGSSTWIVRAIAALAGSLCVPFMYLTGREIFNEEVGIKAAAICAFFPNLIIMSSLHFKDIFCVVLLLSTIYYGLRLFSQPNLKSLAGFAISVILLTSLRKEASVVALCVIMAYHVLRMRINRGLIIRFAVITLILSVTAVLAWMALSHIDFGGSIADFPEAARRIHTSVTSRSMSRTSLSRYAAGHSITGYSLRIAFPLITPVPSIFLPAYYPLTVLLMLGNMVWYALLPFAFLGMVACFKKGLLTTLPVWGPIVLWLAVIAYASAHANPRYIIQVTPFLICLTAYGLTTQSIKQSARPILMILSPVMILLVYTLAKAVELDIL